MTDGFVYMLRCSDGSYYVGSHRGTAVGDRVGTHQNGDGGDYTSRRLPVVCVWSEWFSNIADAVATERRIKGWSRAKKEALIRGDWGSVQKLAKRRGGTGVRPSRLASRAPQDEDRGKSRTQAEAASDANPDSPNIIAPTQHPHPEEPASTGLEGRTPAQPHAR